MAMLPDDNRVMLPDENYSMITADYRIILFQKYLYKIENKFSAVLML